MSMITLLLSKCASSLEFTDYQIDLLHIMIRKENLNCTPKLAWYLGETNLLWDTEHFTACVNKYLQNSRYENEPEAFVLYDTAYEKTLNYIWVDKKEMKMGGVVESSLEEFLTGVKRVLIYIFEGHQYFFKKIALENYKICRPDDSTKEVIIAAEMLFFLKYVYHYIRNYYFTNGKTEAELDIVDWLEQCGKDYYVPMIATSIYKGFENETFEKVYYELNVDR